MGGDLISNSSRVVCMQKWYFPSSHCIEKVVISMELFLINWSSKKYVKEDTSLKCSAIFHY
jgi:hypothetical protein